MPTEGAGREVLALEYALRVWEDHWYLLSKLNELHAKVFRVSKFENTGAVLNFGRFRDYLLGVHRSSSPLTLDDFLAPPDYPSQFFGSQYVAGLASSLAYWTAYSRRVYGMSADLQGLLRATSLSEVRWSDVHFPFPSFAIELAQPIIDGDGRAYGSVLVNSAVNPFQVEILLFQGATSYDPIARTHRKALEKLLFRDELDAANKSLGELFREKRERFCWLRLAIDARVVEELITATAERLWSDSGAPKLPPNEGALATWDNLVRVVVGLVLYLKTLPPKSSHLSEPRMPFRGEGSDPRAITTRAEVCTVTSVIPLTREERVMLGVEEGALGERAQYELACHFREGHWRRPPGQGRNPDAPRTVHVRFTIVRKDRLAEGELPGGAIKTG